MNRTYTNLLLEEREGILFIALNREKKRNAINTETITELEDVFLNLPSAVKSIILYGKGPHFCAGLDLSDLTETNATAGVFHSRKWHRALDQIQYSPAPVVAVLQGACVGGGLELAAACHIRVAESTAFYALPEGQRGIFVGGGGSVRIPKLIGVARMTDMMLTGRVYRAVEGGAIGLSQYVEKEGEGLIKAVELATKIAGNAPMTNYALTNVLPRIVEGGQDVGLMLESMISAISQDSPEAKKRLSDFLAGKSKKVGE